MLTTKLRVQILRMSLRVGMMLISTIAFSQEKDCTARFEVNAGPDIDVCEGGQVNLFGVIGGDATKVVWRGGKGEFTPSREVLEIHYVPTPEEYESGVVLILVASNPKIDCPPARSQVHVRVNNQPKADAGSNQKICSGNTATMKGKVVGKAKEIIWKTNGSGKFDNVNKLEAVYTPSEKDIDQGGCSLEMLAIPHGVCLPDSAAMVLSIEKRPSFTTEQLKTTSGRKGVKLSMTAEANCGAISWATKGSGTYSNSDKAETVYTPSDEDVTKGMVYLEVSVKSLSGNCSTKKTIKLDIAKK